MEIPPDKGVLEVIEWWKEYGFKRSDWERSDVKPLFSRLLEKMDELSEADQVRVFEWIDENGW